MSTIKECVYFAFKVKKIKHRQLISHIVTSSLIPMGRVITEPVIFPKNFASQQQYQQSGTNSRSKNTKIAFGFTTR